MKQLCFFLALGFLSFSFTACEDEYRYYMTIDFEDVSLGQSGYYDGSDKSGMLENGSYIKHIRSSQAIFVNEYAESAWGGYWKGFAVSSLTDTLTAGYTNQYSCMATSAVSKFGLAYASSGDSAVILLQAVDKTEAMEVLRPRSLMITNSVYAYRSISEGDAYSKKFAEGDWFKVTIRGYNDTQVSGEVDVYLADYRGGKKVLIRDWTAVDLRKLGIADRMVLIFDSSDKSAGWINTPAYACIDNIEIAYSDR